MADYASIARVMVDKVTSYINDNSAWKLAKKADAKSILIWYRPSTEFSGNIYKSECIVDASPEVVFQYCDPKPDGLRIKFDKALKGLEIVERVQAGAPEMFLLRTMTHSAAMGMISGRDFIDLVVNINNDEFVGTIAHSVNSENAPESADFVRGRNYYCGILCYRVPGEPQKTKVYHVAQCDIGGMLPRTLVESSLPSAITDFYTNLRAAIMFSEANGH